MNATAASTADPRLDRLYALLPAIHRMRDADQGYALQALLRVIAEQVNIVEDDIASLYDNWFIETASDWAVPYIGDLVGYRPVADGGLPPDSTACDISPVLVPRQEIANLIRYRRRKGTAALLEQLANDIGRWPARVIEFFKLLGWTQNLNHLHLDRHGLADLRDADALDRLDGPFDSLSHSVDVRRINSHRTRGRYNIPSVGVFIWRLRSYAVTHMPAYCMEQVGPHCFTFSNLGQDTPLFAKPLAEPDSAHIAEELNVPAPIRRLAFVRQPGNYYGQGLSFAIWAEDWAGLPAGQIIPIANLIPADLSGWTYVPPLNSVAVDPVLGRIVFPPGQLPRKGVRVTYHYGFPADVGGGEYVRPIDEQPGKYLLYGVDDTTAPSDGQGIVYRVGDAAEIANHPDADGRGLGFQKIAQALEQWAKDKPARAVIEIAASAVYVEQLSITLAPGQSLEIRAAQRQRVVLRMIDWQSDLPDALSISLSPGSRLALDGLTVTGRPVQVQSVANADGAVNRKTSCPGIVEIRHCTLVPGWAIDPDCEPQRPTEPSLEISNVWVRVCIESSIVGAITVQEDQVTTDPIAIAASDSVIDACDPSNVAIGAPSGDLAHALLDIRRCTVFGFVEVHAMSLAENSIFANCVNVGRRQIGCMRYCYVPKGCRTPKRYHCQPDGVIAAVKAGEVLATEASEILRVMPQFTFVRYGTPAYAQLGSSVAEEIRRGADDESEMGVYHDLYQPQRQAHLEARLDEYTPAGMDVGLIFAN